MADVKYPVKIPNKQIETLRSFGFKYTVNPTKDCPGSSRLVEFRIRFTSETAWFRHIEISMDWDKTDPDPRPSFYCLVERHDKRFEETLKYFGSLSFKTGERKIRTKLNQIIQELALRSL